MISLNKIKVFISKRNFKKFDKDLYEFEELKDLVIETREYMLIHFLKDLDTKYFKRIIDKELSILKNNHKDVKNYHRFYTIFTYLEKSKISKSEFKKDFVYLYDFLKKEENNLDDSARLLFRYLKDRNYEDTVFGKIDSLETSHKGLIFESDAFIK